jgi:EAL domain-containing protein (putative c-di-GMP-specific phosphodiesterase class I)
MMGVQVFPGGVVPFTNKSEHGEMLFRDYFMPWMHKDSATAEKMSFAYQPKFKASNWRTVVGWESLFRGCSTRTHAAPGLLFPILAKPEHRDIAIEWKLRELDEAIAFNKESSEGLVSVNFTQAELRSAAIIAKLNEVNAQDRIACELLELDLQKDKDFEWDFELISYVKPLFARMDYDDATLDTLSSAEALLAAGLVDVIKIDISLCVQAFEVEVFFGPDDENLFFRKKWGESHKYKPALINAIGQLLVSYPNLVIVLDKNERLGNLEMLQ